MATAITTIMSQSNHAPSRNEQDTHNPEQRPIVQESPSISQDMKTVGASNVSNLRQQMNPDINHDQNHHQQPYLQQEDSTNARDPSNLSLRDMFVDPNESQHQQSSSRLSLNQHSGPLPEEDDLDQHEYFCHDDDEEDGILLSSSNEHKQQPQDGSATPPDSLHSRNSARLTPSSMITLNREGPTRFNSGTQAQPKDTTTIPDLAANAYSSDSSTDEWSKGRSPANKPVLYSAIGSLEDPSNSSFKWKPRNQIQKYEFPSNRLLAPPSSKQQQRNKNTSNQNNRKITPQNSSMAITVLEPRKAPPPETLSSAAVAINSAISNQNDDDIVNQPTAAGTTTHNNKPSNLRSSKSQDSSDTNSKNSRGSKKVHISEEKSGKSTSKRKSKKTVEMFRPSSDAYTPRMGKKEIKYKPAEKRTPVHKMASGLGTLSRPNFRDALRRVAMIIQQHIVKIERRFESKLPSNSRGSRSDKLFMPSMKEAFSEDRFITPTYKCSMVRVPMARAGMVYGLKKVKHTYEIPTEREIYDFAHRLFKTVQLSSECSIVCLIYVERLMEQGKVPLLANTWRPIVMTGLLLASKVWQDLSSWNIEFTNVYPQYSLQAIHRLEVKFLRIIKWDLYISSSAYAKYYFSLRSLVEKSDFRQRYNRMVGGVDSVQAQEALKVEERSTMVKEEALLQLSRSM